MKRLLLFLLLIFISIAQAAETFELRTGESITVNDRNITLIAANSDSILLCINGEKTIVEETGSFKDVYIDVKKKMEGYAKIRVTYTCKDCKCDNNCDNSICLAKEIKEENKTIENETIQKQETNIVQQNITQQSQQPKETKINILPYLFSFMLLIFLVLLIIFLSKSKK